MIKLLFGIKIKSTVNKVDPSLQEEAAGRKGFEPMIMKRKELEGYCYVSPQGFKSQKDFGYWIELCLAFNGKAKASKKSKTKNTKTKK